LRRFFLAERGIGATASGVAAPLAIVPVPLTGAPLIAFGAKGHIDYNSRDAHDAGERLKSDFALRMQ
jgi:hypothetical protein